MEIRNAHKILKNATIGMYTISNWRLIHYFLFTLFVEFCRIFSDCMKQFQFIALHALVITQLICINCACFYLSFEFAFIFFRESSNCSWYNAWIKYTILYYAICFAIVQFAILYLCLFVCVLLFSFDHKQNEALLRKSMASSALFQMHYVTMNMETLSN